MQRDQQTAARIKPNDAPRILRALEVLETTGESIAAFRANTKPALVADAWRGLALMPDREALYAAINARFDTMLERGTLDEVRAFSERGLDPALPAVKAHGNPALAAYLRGEMSLDDAAEIGKRDTRRYAKRQFTWIANQMPNWPRVAESDLTARVAAALAL
jgi:tRNA dimethylallyltransferase